MPTAPRTHRHSIKGLVVLLLPAVLVLGACASGGDDASLGGADSAAEAIAPDAVLADGEAAAGGEADPVSGVDLEAASDGRHIISTAYVDLTADDAEEVSAQIADLVRAAGGFVTDEVTEQVVDLESRITTAEASVARLRALLDRSGSVADIAQVETELLERETTLETLRGQLRTIERQVDLATITVDVESEDSAPVVDDDDSLPSFLSGLTAGWGSLVFALAGAAAVFGALLPWLVLIGLIGVPAWRMLRARRRSTATA